MIGFIFWLAGSLLFAHLGRKLARRYASDEIVGAVIGFFSWFFGLAVYWIFLAECVGKPKKDA